MFYDLGSSYSSIITKFMNIQIFLVVGLIFLRFAGFKNPKLRLNFDFNFFLENFVLQRIRLKFACFRFQLKFELEIKD